MEPQVEILSAKMRRYGKRHKPTFINEEGETQRNTNEGEDLLADDNAGNAQEGLQGSEDERMNGDGEDEPGVEN